MDKNLLLKDAVLVKPDGLYYGRNILVTDGIIADTDFPEGRRPDNTEIIDLGGRYLFAGFVDLHVHGGGNRDFKDGTAEAFETVVKTHLSHGTTTLLPTAMTASEEDLTDFLKCFKQFKKTSRFSKVTPGVHLEGPYFSSADSKSSGAQPGNFFRLPDDKEIDRLLQTAGGDILRWDAAPELEGSDMFAKKMRKNRILCSIAHTSATSEQAQRGIDNGFSHVTHFYNAVTTYRKQGQRVVAGVVEAAYLNSGVSVELICDGKHIPRDIFRLAVKIKGTNSVMAVTDAMRLAGTNQKSGRLGGLKNGIDVIADGGVAKLPDLSSYAGSIATMDRCLKVLCADYGFSPSQATVMLSKTPAKAIRMEDAVGSIDEGKRADFVIADKMFHIDKVILSGSELTFD